LVHRNNKLLQEQLNNCKIDSVIVLKKIFLNHYTHTTFLYIYCRLKCQFGEPLHSLVVVGKTHVVEQEFLENFMITKNLKTEDNDNDKNDDNNNNQQ
jgi:diphthamide biosynthesis methyltransferase